MEQHLNNTPLLSRNAEHPEIHVICKASYQNGDIYGVWIDTTQPMQDILKQIALMQYEGEHGDDEMLSKGYCPDPDTYFIHSHIGFYDVDIYGNAKIEDIRAYGIFIAQYGDLGAELISINNGNLEKAKRFMDECYLGEYESRAAYATEFFNKHYLSQIPEGLRFCINYKYVKEAIFMRQGFSVEVGGKIHVFKHLKKSEFNSVAE